MNEWGPWDHKELLDYWRQDGTCSFCGCLNPDEVLLLIEAGVEVVPTDKCYKAYIGHHSKIYFHHFGEMHMHRFVELYNNKTMKLEHPGYFYVLPFFMKLAKK